jgi:multisubunit Na+/H+ antiporter MnhC subunit
MAYSGEISLVKTALLGKVAFWLIVIGLFALITPQPAWPEWLGRMVLSSGVALALTTLGITFWKRWRHKDGG